MKAYFLLRKDLNMSIAKLAVQVGHGVDMIHLNGFSSQEWKDNNRRKIVCQVSSLQELEKIEDILKTKDVPFKEIIDMGFTELQGKTKTGIVVYPLSDPPGIIKHLPLYKEM
jgi:peptidyl-tRNA hydrolase